MVLTEKEKEIITKILNKYGEEINLDGIKTYEPVGCKHCDNTGYFSRIGVFEILNITDEIKEAIVRGEPSTEIRKIALKEGYRPLIVDGIKKVINGTTTLEELNKKLLFY